MRVVLVALGYLSVMLCAPLQAHQQKEGLTTVAFNPRSGNMEIAHRFYIHDAEHAVKKIIGKNVDLIADAATRRRFGGYVENHFAVRLDSGEVARLHYVGHEIEGKFFWVYQELPMQKNDALAAVRARFLFEIWPQQRNIVNVERGGDVTSLRFDRDDAWQQVPTN